MHEPIVASYRWSLEDYLTSYRYHLHHLLRPAIQWTCRGLVWFILLSLLIANVVECYHHRFTPDLIMITGFVALLASYPRLLQLYRKHQYLKRPDRDVEVCWEIGDRRLAMRAANAAGEFDWDYVVKVLQTPTGLLLYLCSDNIWHYLPRRGFKNDEDFERLSELARSKVNDFRYLK